MKFRCSTTRDRMYTYFLIYYLKVSIGLCFSNYEIFRGFGNVVNFDSNATIATTKTTITTISSQDTTFNVESKSVANVSVTTSNKPTTLKSIHTTKIKNKKKKINFTCNEEKPSNIGSYEVPTQRDIVLYTKDIMADLFETYKRDAMALLRDIKEITKATSFIEHKCKNKTAYKQCVKLVSGQSEIITKSLVTSLEMEKQDVKDLTEITICSLSEMKKDPISLIKLISQESAMIKFALPGFLRLLNNCSTYCEKPYATVNKKPLRRMTDQDLVVKYFLTKKNYSQLIKDSRRAV